MEMHGGQAIPAFDFMLAPYVKLTWIEEVKKIESLMECDLSKYYDFPYADYEIIFDDNRGLDMARRNTIGRVHQAMESFIHNMNTIHSRGGENN